MNIGDSILEFKKKLPPGVRLIAVSKTKPEDLILEAYNAGHKIFGENKAQELSRKYNNLPKDIVWHMIGHLQSNKVKYIAPFVSVIHSVDSLKLLQAINKEAEKNGRIIDCLFQLKIAREETKFGMEPEEIKSILLSDEYRTMKNIRIIGLMGMATFTDNQQQIITEFKFLHDTFFSLQREFFQGVNYFRERSMGMSDDYTLAVQEGSTMVRIGSLIFGQRNIIN
ncbi:MAG: YggS family pyridoxal phosphate-dependent enzyme [Bacteroidales bacterium]|nr:YggS family pyridoxal phosphate-dependent enzyme [Bacteroidales bacterium]